ncbi:helix-turn-helix transcriptional regulator [Streptomyces sp. NPDC096033]|uniref:helix-turn-helix transcriptional regulator n=1 Tax=Streptomyces sp. NPDC096033 TaxID=3366071 RepID=UPI003800152D
MAGHGPLRRRPPRHRPDRLPAAAGKHRPPPRGGRPRGLPQHHRHRAPPRRRARRHSRHAAPAVAFIEANAHHDIDLAHVAAAPFVTPRAVQHAFRRHLDTTPLAYLRRVRLDCAHRDLLAADPATTTVTEIAARWGFTHPGHFAAHYRDAYRAAPSTTLNARPGPRGPLAGLLPSPSTSCSWRRGTAAAAVQGPQD